MPDNGKPRHGENLWQSQAPRAVGEDPQHGVTHELLMYFRSVGKATDKVVDICNAFCMGRAGPRLELSNFSGHVAKMRAAGSFITGEAKKLNAEKPLSGEHLGALWAKDDVQKQLKIVGLQVEGKGILDLFLSVIWPIPVRSAPSSAAATSSRSIGSAAEPFMVQRTSASSSSSAPVQRKRPVKHSASAGLDQDEDHDDGNSARVSRVEFFRLQLTVAELQEQFESLKRAALPRRGDASAAGGDVDAAEGGDGE